ncbi:PilN domain-containing protein [Alteromonadaceae bacterium BrNp21-10]|nr:PilN domain-containing protein [Alteromonadaceae bacterium BrNp21-10]
MKYRINLYSADLKPKLELFSFSFVTVVWSLVLLALLLWGYVVYQQHHSIQLLSQQRAGELTQLQAQLTTRMTALKNRKPDPALQLKVIELQEAVQGKKLLLSKLGTLTEINSGDYAALMHDLANYRQPQVWLTHIQVQDRQVFLQGATVESQAIPQWLDKLRQSRFFRGQQFEQAKIYRDQDDGLRFDIGSVLAVSAPKVGQ